MEYAYPVRLHFDEPGFVRVDARDLPEVHTGAPSEAEALEMAADAIEVALGWAMKAGLAIPDPSRPLPGERLVSVPPAFAAKLAVWQAFASAGISKAELARRLGLAENEARRILDPDCATKIDRLDAAARALGVRLVVGAESLADAAA